MLIPSAGFEETVEAVRKRLLSPRAKWDSVNYVYVLDGKRRLKGVLSIKELLRVGGKVRMETFVKKNLAVVHPHSHVQVAAARAITHGVKALPVVDDDGVFLGVVGTDAILKTLEHEHVKDLLTFSGLHGGGRLVDVLNAKLIQLIEWRTPWLLTGLFGGMLATSIVSAFHEQLESVIALAFFIPVMVYMGDAVGHQTQTLFIRGIALGHIKLGAYLRREIVVDAAIGVVSAIVLSSFAWLWTQSLLVTWVVGISLFLNILKAGAVAILLPVVLLKFKRDPAIGGGPFTTIVQDILSLLIYFAVASWFVL